MKINCVDQKILKYLMTYNGNNDNILLSNGGLYNIVEILKKGTRGSTKKQLDDLFGNTDFDITCIRKDIKVEETLLGKTSGLSTSNWMVVKSFIDNIKYRPEFVESLKHNTKLSLINKDTNIDAVVSDINKYILQNTNGQIDNVADKTTYNKPEFISEIGNIVHFVGNWADAEGDVLGLEDNVFKNSDGKYIKAPFIAARGEYIENDKNIGFSMDYMGNRHKFICLLPKDETQDINDISLDNIKYYNGSYILSVRVPKFKIAADNDFKEILMNNGITNLFTKDCDFSGAFDITNDDYYVYASTIKQRSVIDVNEYGTEASAVTYVPLAYGGCCNFHDKRLIQIVVNRPFVFSIYDTELDIPIFTGCVKNIEGDGNARNQKDYVDTKTEHTEKFLI